MSFDAPDVIPSRPGLILKPLPDDTSAKDPLCCLGGAPNLPADLDWPEAGGKPMHFFAQIDLGRLPRHDTSGAAMPDFPAQGTIFIFLGLQEWYDDHQPEVLYSPDAMFAHPERALPDTLANLLEDTESGHLLVDGGLSACGRMFRRQSVEVLPFASHRDGWSMTSDFGDTQMRELEQLLGRLEPLPDPHTPPEGVDAPWVKDLPARYHGTKLAKADLFWEDLFEWAKDTYMAQLSLVKDVYRRSGPQDIYPNDRPGVAEVEELWDDLNWTYNDYAFWWLYLQVYGFPGSDYPIDYRLRHFIEVSQRCRGKVPKPVRRGFCSIFVDLEAASAAGETLTCQPLDTLPKAEISAQELADDAFGEFLSWMAPQRTGPEPERPHPKTWDDYVERSTMMPEIRRNRFGLSEPGIVPLQMFGYGYNLQNAAVEHIDDVLLLQLGDAFGTAIDFSGQGAVLQLWVSPEDLAAGRFYAVTATLECT